MRFTLPHLTILFTHNVNEILTTVRECRIQGIKKVCSLLLVLSLLICAYLCAYHGDGWEHMALTKGGADGSPR
jgi:hypothetical protein